MRACAALLLCWLATEPALGQGFELFNGRNHPENDWQQIRTPHFTIVYPAHLAGIETEAAAIAEATYDSLSAFLDVHFDERIRIYLSDEDEIANGFAVRLGNGFTNIWVHANETASAFTGSAKWLRTVIAHELAHIFHYRAVRSWISPFDQLMANPLPSFWAEGVAQYLTESWDAQRGERWLRAAVLDDRLDYNSGSSRYNGRLLYAVGHSQLRYLGERYGDSTLVRILKHRTKRLLTPVHDFATAFKAVTGTSYAEFNDDWRRHVNVHYNAIAATTTPFDSLGGRVLDLPFHYVEDVAQSPDGLSVAAVGLPSLERPARRLIVQDAITGGVRVLDEGAIRGPIAWSPDGLHVAYAKLRRGTQGSLVHDLFLVPFDGGRKERLTTNRRAVMPTFSPDGRQLAFVGVDAGSANVFVLDLETQLERPLTSSLGDLQITGLDWHPDRAELALTRFLPDGTRDLALLDAESGEVRVLDAGTDWRRPVWSPDGRQIAATSLADGVPNVFLFDVAAIAGATAATARTPRRITNATTGFSVTDWAVGLRRGERLLGIGHPSTRRDVARSLPAAPAQPAPQNVEASPFASWKAQPAPAPIPLQIEPNPDLIVDRSDYDPFSNLTHVISGAIPFYVDSDRWGIAGGTSFIEPLGKHALGVGAALTFGDFSESLFQLYYVNRVFRPTMTVWAYNVPFEAQAYGSSILVEQITGGQMSLSWPLDLTDRAYVSNRFRLRLQLANHRPINADDITDLPARLAPPEEAFAAEFRAEWTWRHRPPNRLNAIHPERASGVRARISGAPKLGISDLQYVRPDITAYHLMPAPGFGNLYVQARMQADFGRSLNQDFVGFSRKDPVELRLLGFRFGGERQRVRGYRTFSVGNKVLYSRLEWRVPITPSLNSRILGVVDFGPVTISPFLDAGCVWNDTDIAAGDHQVGYGLEAKNLLRIAGFDVMHAVGFGIPISGDREGRLDWHYRIGAAVPF
ncbi:MAG: hypothetical protein AAGI08_08445 [Bacteroidota bacterium]